MLAAGIVKPPSWDTLGVEKKEIHIPVRDTTLRAVLYKPTTTAPGPLAVYFHGGGWTFGWPESWEHGFAALTSMGITCVGVAYRLAPEHPFPTAAHDAIDSLKWCVEHAGEPGADPQEGVVVLGTSAGANLAAVASHEAVEQGWGERVRGVVLVGAGLVHPDAVKEELREHQRSWEQNRDAPILDVRGVEWFFGESYLLNGRTWTDVMKSSISRFRSRHTQVLCSGRVAIRGSRRRICRQWGEHTDPLVHY